VPQQKIEGDHSQGNEPTTGKYKFGLEASPEEEREAYLAGLRPHAKLVAAAE